MAGDLDRLQGTWNVTALEVDGEQMDVSALNDARIVVTGDRFESLGMGALYEGTIEVYETKKPKAFDLVFTAGHAAGTRNPGIYKLDVNRWTICLATSGPTRPRRFATSPGTGLALETLVRSGKQKTRSPRTSAREAKTRAHAKNGEESSAPATELEGDWQMIEGVFNGKAMNATMMQWAKRVTRGNVTSVVAGPQTMLKASFTLDNSKNPTEIDYTIVEGTNRGKTQPGIVELKGDILKICMSAPGNDRPREFVSKPGDGRSYTAWRRISRSS